MAFVQTASAQGLDTPGDGAAAGDRGEIRAADIVVTANKREERLQDVPIAVTVVSNADIEGKNIVQVSDLVRTVPALGNSGELQIRGIGNLSFSRSSEASVGTVVDGVALLNAAPPSLFDIARVEVLQGPQGTLFGRGASAGLINIVTVAPEFGKFEGRVQGRLGTRDTLQTLAALNVPIAANAALRISGGYTRQPETLRNEFRDSHFQASTRSVRARFKWEPIDAITFNLIADYSRDKANGGAEFAIASAKPNSVLGQTLTTCGVRPSSSNATVCVDGPTFKDWENYGFSAQVDADLDFATVTSISAYRHRKGSQSADSDGLPTNQLNVNSREDIIRNISQEIRFTSPSHQFLSYVVGGYYLDSAPNYKGTQSGKVGQPLPGNLILGQSFASDIALTSMAVFGQATLNFAASIRGIAGFRYGREDLSASTVRRIAPGAIAPFASLAPVSGRTRDTYFTYKLGGEVDLAQDVMAYVTYTRGYKGSAVNDQSVNLLAPLIVRPEIPHAWEAGVKTSLFDRRLVANLALFHTKVTDFQAQFFDPATSTFLYSNAPKLVSKGVEFTLFGKPTDNLSLNFGAIYTDAKYGNGYLVDCAPLQTAAAGCETFTPGNGGAPFKADDAGGNRLVGSPRLKIVAGGEFQQKVTDNLNGFIQIDGVYTSPMNYSAGYNPVLKTGSHIVVGGQIGVRTGDDRMGVALYARNIFDERVPIIAVSTPFAVAQGDPVSHAQGFGPEAFRSLGVTVDLRF